MTKKRSTKKALMTSILALVLCCSMLIGTTFAWFTDSVTSAGNIIQSGNLNVEMYWAEGTEDPSIAAWKDASKGAIFNNDTWEPGYTEARHIKIENKGTLALQYKVMVVANGEVSELADVIDVYYVDPAEQIATRESLANAPKLGTLAEVLATLDESGTGYLAKGESDTITIALKMQESAGNEYQELSLCEGGFSIQLLATQAPAESDSFGDDYDKSAAADFFPGFQGGSAKIAVRLDDQGLTTADASVDAGDVSAVIPAGVMLAAGATSLELTVTVKNSSDANIQLGENEKMSPLDVHIEGVAEGNTTPMLVTLEHYLTTGINTGALRLYHVENGVTVPMTQVATPVNHNEFSYDPMTGNVTLALASFSEVAVVADTNNPWDGETLNYLWYNTSATELTIYNADQLAGFAAIVDGKAEGIAQDSFAGKTVKLNNNIYLSNQLFDPIGWGYENKDWNVNDRDGKPFKGTFDGGQYDEDGKLVGRYTIFDLYQSGWDLINEGTGAAYTYTNCGFGLFAAASNATFKNLTISGAYVRVECVETGILVGLSQGSCTYENIKILDSKIANYQRPAGGLIGEVSGNGTTKITNVTIGSDVVVGSLWGDFDAPVGGVIGAYWDDVNAKPQVEMTDVKVGARLDVYNDITSAYQWHAYRRAGMLIGNTDMSDPSNAHKAFANFLKCSNVEVYYGDWVNYTYCSFSNHNERYPWVRTQAGENCNAFSNPRWGVPNDAEGNYVTDMNHVHAEGDECNVLRQFSQLYGGGQGVYGQDKHDGVTVVDSYYSITYVNDGQTLDIIYVTNNNEAFPVANDQAQKLVEEWADDNITDYNWEFGGWMNAGSTKLTSIDANNTENVVLYPYFNTPYTASFVDQLGNILDWCFFNNEKATALEDTRISAESLLPNLGKDYVFEYWEVRGVKEDGTVIKEKYGTNAFTSYETDVTLYPYYIYKGSVQLIPVDENNDGETDYYRVDASTIDREGQDVVIPDYVNGVPVEIINGGAFDDGKLRDVYLPNTIEKIGKNAFCKNDTWEYPQIQIIFDGTKAEWDALEKEDGWDDNIGKGSVIICTRESTPGYYLQDGRNGFIGIATKIDWKWQSGSYPDWYPREPEV